MFTPDGSMNKSPRNIHDDTETHEHNEGGKEEYTPKQLFRQILLFIWDGLAFFGFDDTKLARLKGKPVDFCSKLTSIRWIILNLFISVVLIIVIVFEGGTYGDQKSKEVSLIMSDEYHYDVQDSLPLRMVTWLWVADLFPRVRRF